MTQRQIFEIDINKLEGVSLAGGELCELISRFLSPNSPEVSVTVIEIDPAHDIRLDVQNLLTAISEHDVFLSHVGREIVNDCIHVLDSTSEREREAYARAEQLRAQDIERANRLGIDPGTVSPVEAYVCARGVI